MAGQVGAARLGRGRGRVPWRDRECVWGSGAVRALQMETGSREVPNPKSQIDFPSPPRFSCPIMDDRFAICGPKKPQAPNSKAGGTRGLARAKGRKAGRQDAALY